VIPAWRLSAHPAQTRAKSSKIQREGLDMADSESGTTSNGGDGDASRRVPATERVLYHILAEMDAGRLAAGGRVNAARIAATLELSAAPVREALSVLAGRGVLDLLPDRGAVMRPFSAREVTQLWALIAPVGSVGLKLAAEAVAAGADTGRLEQKFAEICDRPLEVKPLAFILRLNDWHYAANDLGGNPFVSETLDRLGIPYWDRYLVELIDVHANIDGYLRNYRRMHDAVMSGDGGGASAILHYHADWSVALANAAAARQEPKKRRRK
jgi:DNA-binding GntR family transcriptional regulator